MFSRKRKAKDRYEHIRALGRGGAAVVTRCFDRALRRIVAVKELREDAREVEHKLVAFEREVRLLSFLEHPGIVPIHDHFVAADGSPSYAMKMVVGETLADRIGYDPDNFRAQPQPIDESLRIATRLAETLAYAHDRGVLHLDVKPENVMLGDYGAVYLMDWGNALLMDDSPYRDHLGQHASEEDIAELLKEPEDLITGTPLFMSPEQTIEERRALLPASDVFSLGVLLYLLLTGELAFQGDSIRDILNAIRSEEIPLVHHLRPEVPRRVSRIVERMLTKHPADRIPDARRVLIELRALHAAGVGFPTQDFPSGSVIFQEGDPGDCGYIILDGRVGISRQTDQGERQLAVLEIGDTLGELAVLGQGTRSATATALDDCILRILPGEEAIAELDKLSPWVGSMILTLEQRFRELQSQLDQRPPTA